MFTFKVYDNDGNEIEKEEINPFESARIDGKILYINNGTGYEYQINLTKYQSFKIVYENDA